MRRLLLVTIPIATALASGTFWLAHPLHATAPPPARLEGTVVWPAHWRPAPAFALRDQNGRLISRNALRGQVWAVTFLDSHCTQACPIVARSLATVQRSLGSRYPLTVVIVSVLPRYDTPARVRAFARKAGLVERWHWLLGTERTLSPVWKAYGIEVITGLQHTAAVYLVDRKGDVRIADDVPFFPSQLEASVRALT